jgi:hypothetical protein
VYKGDISNDMPRRVLVNANLIFIKVPVVEKKLKIFNVKSEEIGFDKFLLNKFYLYTTRAGVTLEQFHLNTKTLNLKSCLTKLIEQVTTHLGTITIMLLQRSWLQTYHIDQK